MRRLEVHCRALWARRLARPGRGRQEAFLNDYLPRPLGGLRAAAPLPAGAPAAAALPARAATTAGAPGWSPMGARTRFGHRARIVPCTQSGDVRGVRGNRSGH